MNTRLLSVTRVGCSDGTGRVRPRITFTGDWLGDMGFVHGALLQVLPEPDGMAFHLCDNNIASYSDLLHSAKEKGGNLIRVGLSNTKGKQGATFVTSGRYIFMGGLNIGDSLIAKYEYGIIRVRKIDPNKLGFERLRIVSTSHVKSRHTGEPAPKVRLCGDWLDDIGFRIGMVVTAKSVPGILTLHLQESGCHGGLVGHARRHKLKIIQVAKEPHNRGEPRPCIFISGSLVDRAGFQIGDELAASYEGGRIRLQRLDFEKLGF